RQIQVLFRTFIDQLAQVELQRIGSFCHSLCYHRIVGKAVQHADGLRTLTWKNESKFSHLVFLSGKNRQLNYMRTSAAAQVKPLPTPSIITCCPGLMRPSRTAVSSASGIDAADVLPC